MTQNYELIVKGIRNFENKVTVTLALRDKKRFDGEIFDLDISLDRVEGAALEFYEAAARRSIRQVFLDVAAGLCEGDELLPETRPCSEARYTIKLTVLITRLQVVSFLQLAFQYLSLVAS